jgi:hypothetical protein
MIYDLYVCLGVHAKTPTLSREGFEALDDAGRKVEVERVLDAAWAEQKHTNDTLYALFGLLTNEAYMNPYPNGKSFKQDPQAFIAAMRTAFTIRHEAALDAENSAIKITSLAEATKHFLESGARHRSTIAACAVLLEEIERLAKAAAASADRAHSFDGEE